MKGKTQLLDLLIPNRSTSSDILSPSCPHPTSLTPHLPQTDNIPLAATALHSLSDPRTKQCSSYLYFLSSTIHKSQRLCFPKKEHIAFQHSFNPSCITFFFSQSSFELHIILNLQHILQSTSIPFSIPAIMQLIAQLDNICYCSLGLCTAIN